MTRMPVFCWPGVWSATLTTDGINSWINRFGPNYAILADSGALANIHLACSILKNYPNPKLALIFSSESPVNGDPRTIKPDDDIWWENRMREYRAVIESYGLSVHHVFFDIEVYQPTTDEMRQLVRDRIVSIVSRVCNALGTSISVVYGDQWNIEGINTTGAMTGMHKPKWSIGEQYGTYPCYANMYWMMENKATAGLLKTIKDGSNQDFVINTPVVPIHWINTFKDYVAQKDTLIGEPNREHYEMQRRWGLFYRRLRVPFLWVYGEGDDKNNTLNSPLLDIFRAGLI